jgi:hypothetical protein
VLGDKHADLADRRSKSAKMETNPNMQAKMMKRMSLVQATHTASEQLVYRALWSRGAEEADGARLASCAHTELAAITGRHIRTVQRALAGLMDKGSIEVVSPAASSTASAYRVLSYSEIFRRARASADGVRRAI